MNYRHRALSTLKPRVIVFFLCISASFSTSGFTKQMEKSTNPVSTEQVRNFHAVGKLFCEYAPGCFLALRSGEILAMGGRIFDSRTKLKAEDGKEYSDSAGMIEMFDPKTGQTRILTRMPFKFDLQGGRNQPRQMQALELNDGRIFLVGKFLENPSPKPYPKDKVLLPVWNKSSRRSIQLESLAPRTVPDMFGLLYDLKNQKFEIVKTPIDIPPRMMARMHLLKSGQVLIVGGAISKDPRWSWKVFPETRVLSFDPKSKRISTVGNLLHARYGHEMVELPGNKLLLFGGWGVSPEESKERICTFYSPDGKPVEWEESGRTKEVESFDISSSKSTIIGHTLTGRADFTAILLPNRKIFIHGGERLSGNGLGFYAAELFDPAKGKAIAVGEIETPSACNDMSDRRLHGEGIYYRAAFKNPNLILLGINHAFLYNYKSLLDPSALAGNSQPSDIVQPREGHHMITTKTQEIFVMGGTSLRESAEGFPVGADVIEEFVSKTYKSGKGEKQ